MKPFAAVTILVAASLTAASAAPTQQQVATGSRISGSLQRPSSSGSFQFPGGSHGAGFWSAGPSFDGGFVVPGSFGFGTAGGAQGSGLGGASGGSPSLSSTGGAGGQSGSFQGQVPSGGYYGFGPYQGVWGQSYYPGQGLGQNFYGPNYGNAVSWGYPGYGSSQWVLPGSSYGSGYGYGGGYGGVYPTGFGYGDLGFGSFQRPAAVGQVSGALPGTRPSGASSSSASLQRPAARSQ